MVLYMDLTTDGPITPAQPAPHASLNDAHPIRDVIILYPFLAGLATHLDLTDLHNLSMTCQHVHRTLGTYRTTLIALSLPCQNAARGSRQCARDLVRCCLRCHKATCRASLPVPRPDRNVIPDMCL